MDILGFIALVVTGFAACAEFGSYAFVHPVIRRLPPEQHLIVEQGLLRTFGRVMPVLMTLCVVLSISYAVGLTSFPAEILRFPERNEIDTPVREQLIVELYSK